MMEEKEEQHDAKPFRLKLVDISTLTGENKNWLGDLLISGEASVEELKKITGISSNNLRKWKSRRKYVQSITLWHLFVLSTPN